MALCGRKLCRTHSPEGGDIHQVACPLRALHRAFSPPPFPPLLTGVQSPGELQGGFFGVKGLRGGQQEPLLLAVGQGVDGVAMVVHGGYTQNHTAHITRSKSAI